MVTYLQTVAKGDFFFKKMITEGVSEIQKKKKGRGKNIGKYKTIFIGFLNYFILEAKI